VLFFLRLFNSLIQNAFNSNYTFGIRTNYPFSSLSVRRYPHNSHPKDGQYLLGICGNSSEKDLDQTIRMQLDEG
jgi:hypothetical protein